MISALSPRGDFRFMVVEGSVAASAFIEFMKRILVGTKRKIFLIVDGHLLARIRMNWYGTTLKMELLKNRR